MGNRKLRPSGPSNAGSNAQFAIDTFTEAAGFSADTAWSGKSFRHALRVLRGRPELYRAYIDLPDWLTWLTK